MVLRLSLKGGPRRIESRSCGEAYPRVRARFRQVEVSAALE